MAHLAEAAVERAVRTAGRVFVSGADVPVKTCSEEALPRMASTKGSAVTISRLHVAGARRTGLQRFAALAQLFRPGPRIGRISDLKAKIWTLRPLVKIRRKHPDLSLIDGLKSKKILPLLVDIALSAGLVFVSANANTLSPQSGI